MTSILAILLLISAPAVAKTASEQFRDDVETRARHELAELVQGLCPDQCLVVSVQAVVEDEVPPGTVPGFEPAAPEAHVPRLRSLLASVAVDSDVPAAFRTRLKGLVSQRLRPLGAPVTASVESFAFPVRHPPAPPAAADDDEAPAPTTTATPVAPTPAATAKSEAAQLGKLRMAMVTAAPALVAIALLAVMLLVLAGVLYLAVRRSAPAYEPMPYESPAPAPEAAPVAYPLSLVQRLAALLRTERGLRNALVREALAKGEVALVAKWLRDFGDFLVEDLRGDASIGASLDALAAEVARTSSGDLAGRAQALSELEGRLVAARLSRTAESAEESFAFLESIRPERFAAALPGLPARARTLALRFAPATLRRNTLESLTISEREALAVAWMAEPEVPLEEARRVADELRGALDRVTGGAAQARAAVDEILQTLGRDEQDALLAKLRHESQGTVATLVTESALLACDRETLSALALALPPASLRTYLLGAEPPIRAKLLDALPSSLRRELDEELTLAAAPSREEFQAARREVLLRLARTPRPPPREPENPVPLAG